MPWKREKVTFSFHRPKKKAYDSVPRKLLWRAVVKANISKPIIKLVRFIYKSNTCQIKMSSKISGDFRTRKGLLHNCCLSPTMFKIYMDNALKEWTKKCEKMGVRLTNEKYIFNLLFVIDQVVIAQDEEDIEYLMRKLLDAYREWGVLTSILIKPNT